MSRPTCLQTATGAIAAFIGALLCSSPAVAAEPSPIQFNRDIRPILSDHCFTCHGPDSKKRKAGLRLDQHDSALAALESGAHAIVPNNAEGSELVRRVLATDEDERMPPAPGARLSAQEIDLLRRWIADGAAWQGHWSNSRLERPAAPANLAQTANVTPSTNIAAPPANPNPTDAAKFEIRNPIDAFILTTLRGKGLAPSTAADPATIARRLSFDIVGLPPSVEEVRAFAADSSPEAYEKFVDHLLASPHYGERMAQFWLDLVRYADTGGYHSDNHRDVWLYRDWVIDAFNSNQPFDQFTIEQLAGDLLPSPSRAQKIASGYNRLLQTTEEGGAQAREYAAKYAADRVRNAGSVWLAATIGCAQCHDHKFDPYTIRDFYSFAAFFADINQRDVGRQDQTPLPGPEEAARMYEFDGQIALVKQALNTSTPELDSAQAAWEASLGAVQSSWTVLRPTGMKSEGGAELKLQDDGSLLAVGAKPNKDVYRLEFAGELTGVTGIRLEALSDDSLGSKGPGRSSNGNFVLSEFRVALSAKEAPSTHEPAKEAPSTQPPAKDATPPEQPANAQPAKEQPPKDAATPAPANPPSTAPTSTAPPSTPIALEHATADHSQASYAVAGAIDDKPETGWAILPHAGKSHTAVFQTHDDLTVGPQQMLLVTMRDNFGSSHSIGRFRISYTTAKRPIEFVADALPEELAAIIKIAPADRQPEQREKLAAHYRSIAPLLAPQRAKLAELEKQQAEFAKNAPTSLISMAVAPRETRILARGNWLDSSGEVVQPATPASMPPLAVADRRATRLDLAQWIVSRDNPAAARVLVNRLWRLMFGEGLVTTADDFGAQGAWPTHPELLDWLATELIDSGWNVKHVIKLMVMSGAYRQTSHAGPALLAADPYNKWLARQGRFRLEAEMIRDNALACGGLLSPKIGGPTAKPYQPAGYWASLNFPTREWASDHGENQYRRALYTYWCRTFLHPSLAAFDASSREECVAARPRSSTPMQALALLNDPTYVEAARALAHRTLRESAGTPENRAAWMFERVLSRRPSPEESAVLERLFEKHLEQYRADPPAAEKLASVGDLKTTDVDPIEVAAWTSVARALLNLHETITRN